jgi:hypothetical protein
MISQCSCCGSNFSISSKDQVLFCSSKCEKEHDLFKSNQKTINKKIAKRTNAWQKSNNNTLIIT